MQGVGLNAGQKAFGIAAGGDEDGFGASGVGELSQQALGQGGGGIEGGDGDGGGGVLGPGVRDLLGLDGGIWVLAKRAWRMVLMPGRMSPPRWRPSASSRS
jgi:hypothetical protein